MSRFTVNKKARTNKGQHERWVHSATQHSLCPLCNLSPAVAFPWPSSYMYLSSITLCLSLSPCLSLIICAPFKVSVSGSTSRSTKRAVGCGRTRSPSPQYRVPIQVVRRERSGVITTSGGRLLTSASEQKQQHVKMGIEFGSGLREPHAKERRDSLTDTRDARRVAQNIDRRERVR